MRSKDWTLNAKLYYTARATSETVLLKKMDNVRRRGHSIMNAANLGSHEKCKLFKKLMKLLSYVIG